MKRCKKKACQEELTDMDFDVGRTFMVLTATLVLPVYLALFTVSLSTAAII